MKIHLIRREVGRAAADPSCCSTFVDGRNLVELDRLLLSLFATPPNGVSTLHRATGVETPICYAAALTVLALTASRMTPATMSGCDSIRKWEAPSTSVTVEAARS